MDASGAALLGARPEPTGEEHNGTPSPWLSFDLYQNVMRKTAIYPGRAEELTSDDGQIIAILYTALGLSGEAGEVAGKVKKMIRDGEFDPAALAAELGDVLWYISNLAWEIGVPLSSIAAYNHDKLMDRLERDVIGGNGDNR